MDNATRAGLAALLVAALLVAVGSLLLMPPVQPSTVLAHAATATPPASGRATPEADMAATPVTTTLTITDFDNAIFILSPAVRPERFVDCVDNPYLPLIPGTVYHYETETEDGLETTTVTVTNQVRQVMGISATVVHDTVRLEGQLKEDTFDWYAQDKSGNVWYLGEETAEYEDGDVVSTEGSWQSGVNGAVPGILMLAEPVAGDLYRQEYLKDEATDMGGVLSLDEAASVPFGDFDPVLMTADYNPLDGELEHKFYAPGIGMLAAVHVDGSQTEQLIAVSHASSMQTGNHACGRQGQGVAFVGAVPVAQGTENLHDLAQVSAAEAEEVALDANPDAAVTGTELESERGFLVYEVTLDNGAELLVDAGDGALLAGATDADEADAADDPEDEDEISSEDELFEDEGEMKDDTEPLDGAEDQDP
jgi:uncharacterized membrane protein YkoI